MMIVSMKVIKILSVAMQYYHCMHTCKSFSDGHNSPISFSPPLNRLAGWDMRRRPSGFPLKLPLACFCRAGRKRIITLAAEAYTSDKTPYNHNPETSKIRKLLPPAAIKKSLKRKRTDSNSDDGFNKEQANGNNFEDYHQRIDDNNCRLQWILIVEDEDSLRKAIGRYIAHEGGYVVTGVVDARSAILVLTGTVRPNFQLSKKDRNNRNDSAVASENNSSLSISSCPDCLVLDIKLPGTMNGLELLKTIRSDPKLDSLPAVLLTAKGEDEILSLNV